MKENVGHLYLKKAALIMIAAVVILIAICFAQESRRDFLRSNIDDACYMPERSKHDAEEAAVKFVEMNYGKVEDSAIEDVVKKDATKFDVYVKCALHNDEVIDVYVVSDYIKNYVAGVEERM